MMRAAIGVVVLGGLVSGVAQESSSTAGVLRRRYTDGERLSYLMKGHNNDRPFEARLTAVVKKGADGRFVEEYTWSELSWGGAAQPLTQASRDFRQAVTLAGGQPFTFPDLSRVQPGLIGPVTDLLTFYSDLFLAMHAGQLRAPGDHFLFPSPMVASWADGTRVLIGEDEVDFDIRLAAVDTAANVVTVRVRHVPPKAPRVKVPAEWMRAPVADTPNNWVQVRRQGEAYVASAGKETFDVELKVRLSTGAIVSATLDNLVEAVARDCRNAELTECGPPRPNRTVRRIDMMLTGQ